MSLEADVRAALATVEDPEIHRPITDLGMVDTVSVTGDSARIKVLLTTPACPMRQTISQRVEAAVLSVPGVAKVEVELGAMSDEQRGNLKTMLRGPEPVIPFAQPDSKTQVYAIASGKGGVGKSSLTANLAIALAQQGQRVGVIDADIYGHSIPGILGLTDHATLIDPDLRIPPQVHGVKALSMLPFKPGGSSEPVSWRGPMLGKVLNQFLADFYWGEIDVLLLDLPPGTGDVAISTAQYLPNSELIVVTTPQSAAAEVAVRAGMLAQQTHQRVVGVVENMSAVTCPDCGHRMELFGSGGGAKVSEQLTEAFGREVPLLGQIPFDPKLREGGDAGLPLVVSDPNSAAAQAIIGLATKLTARRQGLAGKMLKMFKS